jgi:hypothetical protein
MNTVRVVRKLQLLAAVAASFALAVLLGCGGGSSTKIPLNGKVTYKNAPVTGGTITLIPASGTGAPFPITIKADGSFETGDAPVGPMKVTIDTDSVTTATPYTMPPGMQMPKDSKLPEPSKDTSNQTKKVAIPPKYKSAATSPLTWDTKAEKYKAFELTD